MNDEGVLVPECEKLPLTHTEFVQEADVIVNEKVLLYKITPPFPVH